MKIMKTMKYSVYTAIVLFSILCAPVMSQERTLDTKIADVLNEMPAFDQDHLAALMKDLDETGQAGIEKLISMLIPAGGEDEDAKIRYALSSLAYYLSHHKTEQERQGFTRVLVDALRVETSKEVQSYIMGLLQVAGNSYASALLSELSGDPELCDPAVRALVGIHTEEAEQHLIQALNTHDVKVQTAIVQGLGDFRSSSAATKIRKVENKTGDAGLRKACLYALSNIPDMASENILFAAAEEVEFSYDPTNATGSFLRFIDRLGETGELKTAIEWSRYLVRNCTDPENMAAKIAGLSLLVKYGGDKEFQELIVAMDYPKKKYRAAALRLAGSFQGTTYTEAWIEKLQNCNTAAKDEIITMLGDRNDPVAFQALVSELDHSDPQVRHAAMVAAGKINPQETLEIIIKIMQAETETDLELIADMIRWLRMDDMAGLLVKNYPTFNPGAKALVLEYIAEKKSSGHWGLVYQETNSKNAEVSAAAFKSLSGLAKPEHLDDILQLMIHTGSGMHTEHLQEAAISALQDYAPKTEGFNMILSVMNASDSTDRAQYLPILSGVGGIEALNIIYQEFNEGNQTVQESAFMALTDWETADVLPLLYTICGEDSAYHDRAFTSYVNLLSQYDMPDEQSRLLLLKIWNRAENVDQKNLVIQHMGRTRTFLAMCFVASFLEDPLLKQAAARSLIQITLPSGEYPGQQGRIVRQYLEKVSSILEGEERDYEKARIEKYLSEMPDEEGFVPMFNGTDLQGWKGLVGNPESRSGMTADELAEAQAAADSLISENWAVRDGMIVFSGHGQNLVSEKDYGNFEMLVDWKITKNGDSGIYLRGTPQVQIWDTSRRDAGAQVGSGGLYNNQEHESIPLLVADNPVGDWNTFHIKMIGERVTVHLNGHLVVDHVILENYWNREKPIYPTGPIELQAHGTDLAFKNIYVRELPQSKMNELTQEEIEAGFVRLFNGENLDGWTGNKTDYVVENGEIVIYPGRGGHGNLFTGKEYGDFILRFEFQLTPGANNGLGIRAPLEGDAAYVGMELQILDNTAEIYKDLEDYQFHGSVYGVIPAKRGYLNPVGEWNEQEVVAMGPNIKVTLNGAVILDGNIHGASKDGTIDGNDHPGLLREKGHIGFLGHGSIVHFRNIRIKSLDE
jgi:HEAT repeat protein